MINVSTQMGFENREYLMNRANAILQKSGASQEQSENVVRQTVFEGYETSLIPQANILKASTQITLNNSLKETLKYLQAHAADKRKTPVFGELWKIIGVYNEESNNNPYKGELLEFEISKDAKNIFAA